MQSRFFSIGSFFSLQHVIQSCLFFKSHSGFCLNFPYVSVQLGVTVAGKPWGPTQPVGCRLCFICSYAENSSSWEALSFWKRNLENNGKKINHLYSSRYHIYFIVLMYFLYCPRKYFKCHSTNNRHKIYFIAFFKFCNKAHPTLSWTWLF
jgi:hypothetical protein